MLRQADLDRTHSIYSRTLAVLCCAAQRRFLMLEHIKSSTNTGRRHRYGGLEGINETLRLLDEAITRLRRAGAATNFYEISALELVRADLTERLFGVRPGPADDNRHTEEVVGFGR
jgi:hypothetical protein